MDPLMHVTAEHRRVALRCLEGVIVHTPGRGIDAVARAAWETLRRPGGILEGSEVVLTQEDLR